MWSNNVNDKRRTTNGNAGRKSNLKKKNNLSLGTCFPKLFREAHNRNSYGNEERDRRLISQALNFIGLLRRHLMYVLYTELPQSSGQRQLSCGADVYELTTWLLMPRNSCGWAGDSMVCI